MTVTPLVLNQLIDDVRRKLELWPLIDQSGNPSDSGSPSPAQPDPNNITIIRALNEGINYINRSVRCGPIYWLGAVDVQPVPVWMAREWWVDFSASVSDPGDMNEVTDALWITGGQTYPLESYYYYAEVKASAESKPDYPAGRPYRYRVSGTQVGLIPPPSTEGQLYLLRTAGIPLFIPTSSGNGDNSQTIQYLPIAFQDIVQYKAVALLSSRDASSVEAQQRFSYFDSMAQDGLANIQSMRNGFRPDVTDGLKDNQRMIPAAEQQRRQAMNVRGPGT